jgi:hypothetical protein
MPVFVAARCMDCNSKFQTLAGSVVNLKVTLGWTAFRCYPCRAKVAASITKTLPPLVAERVLQEFERDNVTHNRYG